MRGDELGFYDLGMDQADDITEEEAEGEMDDLEQMDKYKKCYFRYCKMECRRILRLDFPIRKQNSRKTVKQIRCGMRSVHRKIIRRQEENAEEDAIREEEEAEEEEERQDGRGEALGFDGEDDEEEGEDEYDERYLAADELGDDDRIAVLEEIHHETPPSTNPPKCKRCHQKNAAYFTDCGHWFWFCAECFAEEYTKRSIPPKCDECTGVLDTVYPRKSKLKLAPYKRAMFYPSLHTLTEDGTARHASNDTVAVFREADRKALCSTEGCKSRCFYSPDCKHLDGCCQDHLGIGLDNLLECNHEEPEVKDFLLGSRESCQRAKCTLSAYFFFNCGHHSRFCLRHMAKNRVDRDADHPYNISAVCHVCGCENIVYVPHPELVGTQDF